MTTDNQQRTDKLIVPDDWGVEVRSRKVKDFYGFIAAMTIFITLIVLAVVMTADRSFLIFCVVIDAIFVLSSLTKALDKPTEDAERETEEKIRNWEYDVLLPYIEHRYDVELMSYELRDRDYLHLVGRYRNFYKKAEHGRRQIRASISGIEPVFGSDYGFTVIGLKQYDDPYLVERVEPERPYNRTLPVVNP